MRPCWAEWLKFIWHCSIQRQNLKSCGGNVRKPKCPETFLPLPHILICCGGRCCKVGKGQNASGVTKLECLGRQTQELPRSAHGGAREEALPKPDTGLPCMADLPCIFHLLTARSTKCLSVGGKGGCKNSACVCSACMFWKLDMKRPKCLLFCFQETTAHHNVVTARGQEECDTRCGGNKHFLCPPEQAACLHGCKKHPGITMSAWRKTIFPSCANGYSLRVASLLSPTIFFTCGTFCHMGSWVWCQKIQTEQRILSWHYDFCLSPVWPIKTSVWPGIRSVPSCTTMWVKAWKKASSPKLEKILLRWRKTMKRCGWTMVNIRFAWMGRCVIPLFDLNDFECSAIITLPSITPIAKWQALSTK